MSRNNDLPMLPPWLSESDVTQSGYEAPVENLPHEDFIPEQALKKRSKRKPDDKPEADGGKKRRKGWRKDKPDAPEPDWGRPPGPETAAPQGDYRTPDSIRPSDEFHSGGFAPDQPQHTGDDFRSPQQDPRGAAPSPPPQGPAMHPAPDPNAGSGFPPPPPHTGGDFAPPQHSGPRPPYPDAPQRGPEQPSQYSDSRPSLPDAPPHSGQRPSLPDSPQREPDAYPSQQYSGSRPPLAQSYSGDTPPGQDPSELTVRVPGRPDLPPPPAPAERSARPPLPEPPGPGDHAEGTPSPEPTRSGGRGPAETRSTDPESGAEARRAPGVSDEPAPPWLGPARSAEGTQPATAPGESADASRGPAPQAAPPRLSSTIPGPAAPRPDDTDTASPGDAAERPQGATGWAGSEGVAGGSITPPPSPFANAEVVRAADSSAHAPNETGAAAQGFAEQPSHQNDSRTDRGPAPQSQNDWSTASGTGTAATGFDSQTGSQPNSGAPQDPTVLGQVPPSTGGQAPYGDPRGGVTYSPATGGQAPVGEGPGEGRPAWSAGPQGTSGAPQDPTVRGPVPPNTGPQSPLGEFGAHAGQQAPYGDSQIARGGPAYNPSPVGQAPVGEPPADPRYAAPPQGGQWQSPPQEQQWGGGQPYPPQHQPHPQQYQQPGIQPSLDDVPVRRAKKAPGSGWRRAVHHISGGAINPGMSAEELRLQELVARIRQPVRGDYRIAVLSLKGGVGKTTTTMGIGSIFASIRGDRVIAVDANPDFGTLSQRVPLQTRSTVRDLLLDQTINSYADVRRHTSQATSRLEVLGSERDPASSESFNEDEYRQVARVLQRYYNIILTDCGTGLMHSAMAGVLDLAHSLVLISSSAIDGARSAAATLDWLSLHGHDHLVRNAVVVINLPRPGSPNVGIQQLREYFLSRCRAVHIIPYDPHLSEGAEIDLAQLHKNTKRSLVELAATVADDFATDHRRFQRY
ncbi:MinD/ParA family ATP-binding protein [Nocardia thraciensis]